jgi:hypothetical protein
LCLNSLTRYGPNKNVPEEAEIGEVDWLFV